jgi:hypothetical protein
VKYTVKVSYFLLRIREVYICEQMQYAVSSSDLFKNTEETERSSPAVIKALTEGLY